MRSHRFLPLLFLLLPTTVRAQSGEGSVETFAHILAAEDARDLDDAVFRRALADPDSSVRREAALALGRIRNPAAVPLLAPLLRDPDSLVQATTIFALGLLGDQRAVPLLLDRARDGLALAGPAAMELVTSMARLGGEEASHFIASVLDGSFWNDRDDHRYLAERAALEAWRLGPDAPVGLLLGMLRDPSDQGRASAMYSIARLHPPAAGARLVEALSDRTATQSRGLAARALSRAYADSAQLEPGAIADLLVSATHDDDPGVRVNAVRTLAGYHLARVAVKVIPLLDDPNLNVQVEAAHTLGDLGGSDALAELTRIVASPRGSGARRREALLSLARLDSTAFIAQVGSWAERKRLAPPRCGGSGVVIGRDGAAAPFLEDRDARVVAAALQGWTDHRTEPDSGFLRACRKLLLHRDAAIRSLAADGLRTQGGPSDIPALMAAYTGARRDSFPDAALSALGALVAIVGCASAGPAGAGGPDSRRHPGAYRVSGPSVGRGELARGEPPLGRGLSARDRSDTQ